MTVEPLWTGPTDAVRYLSCVERSIVQPGWLPCPPGTEVALVRADSIPTREQVHQAIQEAITACVREDGQGFKQIVGQVGMAFRDHWADEGPSNLSVISAFVADAVMLLLSGQTTTDGG